MELFRAIRIPHPLPKNADTHPGICIFYYGKEGIRTDLTADVRWTSACRQLDGGNTIISSNPASSATFISLLRML